MKYQINPSANINSRSFGDEVVIVNFLTGIYYSLLGSAAQIWEGLMAGQDTSCVREIMALHTSSDPETFARAFNLMVETLVNEGLIIPLDGISESHWSPLPSRKDLYDLPAIQRFDDLEDLLSLDPIHEVDEIWPNPSSD